MSHIPSHTACTIVRVESYHGPNAGREIINENFECLNQVVGELQTASATGATIVSASTNIVLTTGFTNGNIPVYTVGVTDNPIFASLSANSISATTFYSGSTNLNDIFLTTGSLTPTYVHPGSNIITGGTLNNPIINLVSSPSVNNFTASGDTSLQGTTGTTIHASQFFSMTPYTGSNPIAPPNDTFWFHSGATGIITLNYRIGGLTKIVELA